ncbi:uncharacterized protein LOC133903253 [Phragmites australis]|uniref:uncharacterized protein LOC133903253 n=1 Tax=Phragmites australis TaxID=29695 RepID=UPI002D7764A9|nr:uncharacterized protein LOC133903253 [Phragmites australis]
MEPSETEEDKKNARELHRKALQGIVTANGFFTAAVFVGISGTVTPSPSLPQHCVPGADIVQTLFLFEVLSFTTYLVSSLIAQGMMLAIDSLEAIDPDQTQFAVPMAPNPEDPDASQHYPYPLPARAWDVSMTVRTWSAVGTKPLPIKEKLWWFRNMMKLSVALSVLGSVFLMLSMVDVIQLKLGLLSCGGMAALGAVLVLTLLGLFGFAVYLGSVIYSLGVY